MTTLELLAENWKNHNYREAYPADEASLAILKQQQPATFPINGAVLLEDCQGYVQGEPLFHCVYLVGDSRFVKLSTRSEFIAEFCEQAAA